MSDASQPRQFGSNQGDMTSRKTNRNSISSSKESLVNAFSSNNDGKLSTPRTSKESPVKNAFGGNKESLVNNDGKRNNNDGKLSTPRKIPSAGNIFLNQNQTKEDDSLNDRSVIGKIASNYEKKRAGFKAREKSVDQGIRPNEKSVDQGIKTNEKSGDQGSYVDRTASSTSSVTDKSFDSDSVTVTDEASAGASTNDVPDEQLPDQVRYIICINIYIHKYM